ncbi:conserved hypothetical protein [Gloeothece citriformis PCC 7424]|uniref:DUF3352 domain-containing protein n=1 Tax=Gloeothece citriformis (strain PCC 7424) TaxID=65393 RepID=B7KER5_GLOC7|nr:DUF3352 domain-containing protein [Gloeothece citriformis]ACK69090.1 conserved hypothetical protein [Gloeothece citriformis PCC 7424]
MTTTNSKKSGCGCFPILAVITLAAGGIYYWRGELLGKKLTPLEVAKAIPEEAFLTSYITTDAQVWSQLSKFGTPEAQKVFSQKIDQLKDELSSDNINYVEDIQPWLGGVMLAFLPSQTGQDSPMLIVAGIQNKLKAKAFQDKLKNQSQTSTTKTDYKGITITTIAHQNDSPVSVAYIGNYLILSDNIQTVKEAIDTLKGEPSYAQKSGVKQALSQSLTLKNSLGQIYITDYQTLIGQGLQNPYPNSSIPLDPWKQLEQIESIVVGVGIEEEGLRFQAITKLNSSANQPVVNSNPGKILEKFPAQTFAFMSGQGIKEGWSNLVTQAQTNQDLQLGIDQIRQGFRMVNLDVDRDIFSWMDGEFAIGMMFTPQSSIPQVNLGGMMVWETSDRPTAENTLNQLNQIVRLSNISVQSNQVNGIKVTDWKTPPQTLLLSYGWLDRDSLAMTIGMPFTTATNVKANSSLAQSSNFQEITQSLPKKNLGYFYLDFKGAVNEMEKIAQQQGLPLEPDSIAILKSINGLAATAIISDQTTNQLDMILGLKSSQ